MITRKDRILGGIYGLLVGDAIGIPYETTPPDQMPDLALVDDLSMVPVDFKRKHKNAKPMTYSDDGSQALCLLASLLHCHKFDAQDFGERLVRWFDDGYLAASGGAFGSGGTTRTALGRIRSGVPAAEAGLVEETALGNGALMRTLPLVLWHNGSDEELIELAMAQCRVTHAHPRAQAAVAAYCVWAKRLLDWTQTPIPRTVPEVLFRGDHPHAMALDAMIAVSGNDTDPPGGNAPQFRREAYRMLCEYGGYRGVAQRKPTGGFHVVDTFFSAIVANGLGCENMAAKRSCRGVNIWAKEPDLGILDVIVGRGGPSAKAQVEEQKGRNKYENVLRVAIQYGLDTDTVASVAGGVAGVRFGVGSIRKEWIDAVLANAHSDVLGLIGKLAEK